MAPCNAKESLTIPQSNSVLVSSFSIRMFNVPPKVTGILRTVKDSRISEICKEAFYFNIPLIVKAKAVCLLNTVFRNPVLIILKIMNLTLILRILKLKLYTCTKDTLRERK